MGLYIYLHSNSYYYHSSDLMVEIVVKTYMNLDRIDKDTMSIKKSLLLE